MVHGFISKLGQRGSVPVCLSLASTASPPPGQISEQTQHKTVLFFFFFLKIRSSENMCLGPKYPQDLNIPKWTKFFCNLPEEKIIVNVPPSLFCAHGVTPPVSSST